MKRLVSTFSAWMGVSFWPISAEMSKNRCQLAMSCQPQPSRASMSPRKTFICWRIEVVPSSGPRFEASVGNCSKTASTAARGLAWANSRPMAQPRR